MNIAAYPIWKIDFLGKCCFILSKLNCKLFKDSWLGLSNLRHVFIYYSTSVSSCWEYSTIENLDFDKTWNTVKEIILKNFAGDYVEGIPSPSVQNTIYLSQQDILREIQQVRNPIFIHNP